MIGETCSLPNNLFSFILRPYFLYGSIAIASFVINFMQLENFQSRITKWMCCKRIQTTSSSPKLPIPLLIQLQDLIFCNHCCNKKYEIDFFLLVSTTSKYPLRNTQTFSMTLINEEKKSFFFQSCDFVIELYKKDTLCKLFQ